MRRSLTLSCLTLVIASFAAVNAVATPVPSGDLPYYPQEFFAKLSGGSRDAGLKTLLFNILTKFHVTNARGADHLAESCAGGEVCYRHGSLGYKAARRILFGQLHLREASAGYSIRDVYCQREVGGRDFTAQPPGPGLIPDPTVLNAEHTWPQSRFSSRFKREQQKSDLHILYPVLARANSSRGNIEFGDVVTVLSSPCPQSERGYSARGDGKVYFEVPDAHKGNAARAIFYFAVRYDLQVSEEEEVSLKAWHRVDPPDEEERARNSGIFAAQKNRNPFIDYPELVELISDF